jgi:hypothetical protein
VPGWIRWFRWISPFFFSFRIILISQFRNRQFSCEGVIGEANTAQCVGNNALRSLLVSPDEPLWPLFLGNVGFIVIVLALSLLLLTVWKPGGVRHAQRVASGPKGKELTSAEIDLARAKVFVQAENVKLTFVRRLFPSWKKVEVPILTNINAVFPPGEVTVSRLRAEKQVLVLTAPRSSWVRRGPARAPVGLPSCFTPIRSHCLRQS